MSNPNPPSTYLHIKAEQWQRRKKGFPKVEEEVEEETPFPSEQHDMHNFLSFSLHRDGLHTKVISGMREGWGP